MCIWTFRVGANTFQHNSDVNKKDKSNYTPLHNTLRNKAILSIVEILLENGADMAAKNSYGHTPLHQACCFGELEIVQTLLRHHADINAKGRGDITPLVEACMFGHLEVVKELLKHNPNIHAIYKGVGRQYTPLDMAAVYGFSEIVEELLKHGADINFGSCLHLAISNDHHEVVKTLLKYGCNTQTFNTTFPDCTAFELALHYTSVDFVKMIAFHGN